MTRIDPDFKAVRSIKLPKEKRLEGVRVDVFVTPGYCGFEVSSVFHALQTANDVLHDDVFRMRYVSDVAGIVEGRAGQMVRAVASTDQDPQPDMMIIVGGDRAAPGAWMPRLRQMQRQARCVVLLSDAATAYIKATQSEAGQLTTHWRDVETLRETGYYPTLTEHLAEQSNGVVTAAGSGCTAELMIGFISPYLEDTQIAELGNLLLLPTIRKTDADQPKDLGGNAMMFDRRVTEVIRLMEAHISDPLDIPTLAQRVGLSSRQVERVFREVFDCSPGKFYKQLRTKKAWALIQETLLPLAEIAVATGFGSVPTLTKSVQTFYGITPAQSRARKAVNLMHFA